MDWWVVNGWIGGWLDRWMDWWVGGWMDGLVDGWMMMDEWSMKTVKNENKIKQ